MQHEKTQFFSYSDSTVINCGTDFHADADCRKRFINFLGFTFDGNQVSIRAKTISKYYSRMHRKAKTIKLNAGYSPKGKKISKKELYKKYSIRGAYAKKGNFLTYVNRAKSKFCIEGINAIDRDTKNHMRKISQALK